MNQRLRQVTASLPVTELIYLADGTPVPKACVEVLDEFEKIWPGATFQKARGAIASRVIQAWEKVADDQN